MNQLVTEVAQISNPLPTRAISPRLPANATAKRPNSLLRRSPPKIRGVAIRPALWTA